MRNLVLSSLIVLIGLVSSARADQNPNQVFKGKIVVSDKRFPMSAKSGSAYVAAINKQAKTTFAEDKEKQGWKLFFVGFLKSKLDDLEYLVRVTDITSKPSRVVSSFEQFTSDRGEQTLTTSFTILKKDAGVNRTLMVEILNAKKQPLASGTFKVTGEGEKYTGKVDFSKDEEE